MRVAIVVTVLLALASGTAGVAQDRRSFDNGSRPRVFINWQSCEAQGFPASWRTPFTDAVINAYTRIQRVIGADVRPQFWNYTTGTTIESGQILIRCNEMHATPVTSCAGQDCRLASTYGFVDRPDIVIHRKNRDGTLFNWTPFWENPGEVGMLGVLMHELLHALGLDHSAGSKTIMAGLATWVMSAGPWSGDMADLRAQYRLREQNRLRQLATYDGGGSWTTLSNDITGFGPVARTTNSISVAGNNSDATYVVGWTDPRNRLTWVFGNGISFRPADWTVYTEHPRPVFGGAMASDHRDTYLWAVVDGEGTSNTRRVRVLRSDDDGRSWAYTAFPDVRTYGRPGLATARVAGVQTWVVVWARYDEANQGETGYIYGSVSTNNGASWSSPHRVDGFYRVLDGVSIELSPAGECRLTFTWAGEKGTWEYGGNRVRTVGCSISGGTVTRASPLCTQSEKSRLAPDLAWNQGAGRFVLGIREQDFNTSLDSMRAAPGACPSGYLHIPGSTTHVAPALASNTTWNETVMWLARE